MSQGDAASQTEPAGSASAGRVRHRPTSETLAILGVGIALAGLMLTVDAGLRADLRALRADMNTLASELRGEMSAQGRDLRSELGAVRDDVAGVREEVGDLRRDVATLREEIEEIKVDTAARTEASAAVSASRAGVAGIRPGPGTTIWGGAWLANTRPWKSVNS